MISKCQKRKDRALWTKQAIIQAARIIFAGALGGTSWQPVFGDGVSFAGAVTDICVVEMTAKGALGFASTGTILSSEIPGGSPAILSVAIAGTAPTLSFSTPHLTGPAPSIADAIVQMGYTPEWGVRQELAGGPASYKMRRFHDRLVVAARAISTKGFDRQGIYAISSTVTCQQ